VDPIVSGKQLMKEQQVLQTVFQHVAKISPSLY